MSLPVILKAEICNGYSDDVPDKSASKKIAVLYFFCAKDKLNGAQMAKHNKAIKSHIIIGAFFTE